MATSATDPDASTLSLATYTNDSTYNDEWIFHRMLPLTALEAENRSEKSYNPGDWSVGALFVNNAYSYVNCYSYALNSHYTICGYNDFLVIIGQSQITTRETLPTETEQLIFNKLRSDALKYNFSIERINQFEPCPNGKYKIALFLDSSNYLDFHFYRQNSNGTWSHKLGAWTDDSDDPTKPGRVTRVDVDGNIVFNPEMANRNVKSEGGITELGNYDLLIGYYAVTPIDLLYIS